MNLRFKKIKYASEGLDNVEEMKFLQQRCRIKWLSAVQMVQALLRVGEIYKVCLDRESPHENFCVCALYLSSLRRHCRRANIFSAGPIVRHINVAR